MEPVNLSAAELTQGLSTISVAGVFTPAPHLSLLLYPGEYLYASQCISRSADDHVTTALQDYPRMAR